ncbi:MAG: non-homologous end-joining DNA ligase [Solirubrobacterales bacterium]
MDFGAKGGEPILSTTTQAASLVQVDNREVALSHLDKVLWPADGYTKRDLIEYYAAVYPHLAPHLSGRPLVVTRFPGGIDQPSFYQKNAPPGTPDWVTLFPVYSTTAKRTIQYVICDQRATLVWLANLACIELHPWMSDIADLDRPNSLVFDLDPMPGVGFDEVIMVAGVIRELLSYLQIDFAVKTSGATGLHLVVPLAPAARYEEARGFAQLAAEMTAQVLPKTATVVRAVKNRGKRVYVDYLQNIQGKTICSVYSVRPKNGATVSTPIRWEELSRIKPEDFTIRTVPERLKTTGDLFEPVLVTRQRLDEAARRLRREMRTRRS